MRWTQGLIPTFKEVPAEAEIPSHRLMLRAGLMSKLAAGLYTLLPLGLRVTQRVGAIVREEMNATGALEILMPILSPRELWEESGRWQIYGDELMRMTDRHDRDFALGPTHEEIVTDLARRYVKSYRQIPMTLYQMQTKFRDEVRPRFGVMRAREFLMKDAYSFHRDEASLDETYRAMHLAYRRIFARCGLRFAPVEADSGAIGGDVTHEFMVFAGTGEAEVLSCAACGYAANVEQATMKRDAGAGPATAAGEAARERVATPGKTTVEEVAAFLRVAPSSLVKTLFYRDVAGRIAAALIPGDRELSEPKLARELGGIATLASAEEIAATTGGPLGFSGPVGLAARGGVSVLLADPAVVAMRNMVTGSNEADAHFVNVNTPRDFRPDRVVDLLRAREGDPCPSCGAPLASSRGIEVGQIFKLGTKYSAKLQAVYLDETGSERPFVMGCYGIGVTRTVAAAIEQYHDDDGVAWPISIAPFEVEVLPVNMGHAPSREFGESLYRALTTAGLAVLLDDRDERPGNKFKDADLIGIPFRVTVGEKGLAENIVELRRRDTRAVERIPVADAAARVAAAVERERRAILSNAPSD